VDGRMKKPIRKYLNEVKRYFVKFYAMDAKWLHIDDPKTLQEFTGYGSSSEGGMRCEGIEELYRVTCAEWFPKTPEGYHVECINHWSFAVYPD
jgi:hypothetical protein